MQHVRNRSLKHSVMVAVYEEGLGEHKLLQVAECIHDSLDQKIRGEDLAKVAEMSQFH
ncbi:hypothetical protein [Thermocoleostomius sinensis]|uniref:Uncharacterized protein n=1 Tax=Thermocoleostomius sinensis A174 TaxID=2016057 RepID=A0A9E9C7E2_9CYAN|nr:hypothetical protein [Thermocoleostomius sinensis]WAL59148.1 hypothetical protein OXH18_18500 [Thermocoleostomius sinensis A174]